jgi:hypothetical protein
VDLTALGCPRLGHAAAAVGLAQLGQRARPHVDPLPGLLLRLPHAGPLPGGRNPPCWSTKQPTRPYKSATQNRVAIGNVQRCRVLYRPGRAQTDRPSHARALQHRQYSGIWSTMIQMSAHLAMGGAVIFKPPPPPCTFRFAVLPTKPAGRHENSRMTARGQPRQMFCAVKHGARPKHGVPSPARAISVPNHVIRSPRNSCTANPYRSQCICLGPQKQLLLGARVARAGGRADHVAHATAEDPERGADLGGSAASSLCTIYISLIRFMPDFLGY